MFHKNIKAFTLVEVVVATALLVLTMAAFVGSFVVAKKSAVIADNRMNAVHNARRQMETLLGYRYVHSNLNIGTYTTTTASVRYGVELVTNAQYTVKNITVTSKWVNPAARVTSEVVLVGSICSELHQ